MQDAEVDEQPRALLGLAHRSAQASVLRQQLESGAGGEAPPPLNRKSHSIASRKGEKLNRLI